MILPSLFSQQQGISEMDFRFSPEDEAFRRDMRAALRDLLPADIRERQHDIRTQSLPVENQKRWFALLEQKGWSVPHWPEEYGGTGWSPLRRFIFEDLIHALDGPEFHWGGTHMIGPVIYSFGSQAMKDRFLPLIRRGDYYWAQGFSEPGSGSDLVSLRTHARLEGDHYVVNGQKIWTSGAFESEWGFFLIKTDLTVKPQRGISFLLIDMQTPGITVRRIPQINGEAHLCEVFLDDVKVPVENLVGEAGQGWTYAKYLLEHERTSSSFIFWSKRELARSERIARAEMRGGRPLVEDPIFRTRLEKLRADLRGLEWSVLRVLANDTSPFSPAIAASILKVRGSELQQAITEFQVDLLGGRAMRFFDPELACMDANEAWPAHVPGRTGTMQIIRAATIYGGSKQVQKNIMAKLAFGL